MKIIIKSFEKEWEVNSISRKQRRHLHTLNKKVYAGSTFNVNAETPEIVNLITDYDVLEQLVEEVLELAFDNIEELDKKLTDTEQDVLADKILVEYLSISPKEVGD